MYRSLFKHSLDYFISILLFVILSPLFIIITIILFIANEGKPFFIQPRPGKNGKVFKFIKFKTMSDAKDKNGILLSDAERITFAGNFIRKSSLDEVPQLINVMKGDMSLVGPRPLLVEYLELYDDFQQRRHEVLPGITGWAQVNGRNAISWNEKFKYDVWYVDNISFYLDLKIIWLTVIKVFKREGISQEGQSTVEYFKGNEA